MKREFNQYKQAKELLLTALKVESNNVYILLNLAMCCQGVGEVNDAKKYVLKVIDIEPKNTSAHKLLSTLINYNSDQEHFEKMKELIDQEIFKQFSPTQKVELLFALSKAYEDIKDFENSFNFLKQANLIENKSNIKEIENIKKLFDSIKKLFNSIEINQSEFTNKNSGIPLYFVNSNCHCSLVKGSSIPEIGFHSTIERPETVNRVIPPTTTMTTIITNNSESQVTAWLFGNWE